MDITRFFDAAVIWPDTNGDGYPDDLGLTIDVDPDVTDSNIWAAILNLAGENGIYGASLKNPPQIFAIPESSGF